MTLAKKSLVVKPASRERLYGTKLGTQSDIGMKCCFTSCMRCKK